MEAHAGTDMRLRSAGDDVPPNMAEQPARWRPITRIAFRFVFCYFLLYNVSTFFDLFPFTDTISEKYESLWQKLVPWVGNHVLHLASPITIFTNGSSDTIYDYVKVLSQLIIVAVAALAWSILDRRRSDYRALHQWFSLLMRLALGSTLISYGAVKVIKSQFPDPSLSRLMQPFGYSSPMGLLWTFMGHSRAYNIFTGGVEVVGGLLLFIPRLTTLGALLSIGALANVFMLNMSYDVPVKLYSFHLLLMAVLLAAPDLRRLGAFFVLHRKVQLGIYSPVFRRTWTRWGSFAIQFLLITYSSVISFVHAHQAFAEDNARPPLYGIWAVDEFALDGRVVPQDKANPDRWNHFIVDSPYSVALQSTDGARDIYRPEFDVPRKKLTLIRRDDPAFKVNLTFSNPDPDHLILDGYMGSRHINAKLHRTPPPTFLLNTRGFHWINEYPYNH